MAEESQPERPLLRATEEPAFSVHSLLLVLGKVIFAALPVAGIAIGNVWVYSIYPPDYEDFGRPDFCHRTVFLFAFGVTTAIHVALGVALLLALGILILNAVVSRRRRGCSGGPRPPSPEASARGDTPAVRPFRFRSGQWPVSRLRFRLRLLAAPAGHGGGSGGGGPHAGPGAHPGPDRLPGHLRRRRPGVSRRPGERRAHGRRDGGADEHGLRLPAAARPGAALPPRLGGLRGTFPAGDRLRPEALRGEAPQQRPGARGRLSGGEGSTAPNPSVSFLPSHPPAKPEVERDPRPPQQKPEGDASPQMRGDLSPHLPPFLPAVPSWVLFLFWSLLWGGGGGFPSSTNAWHVVERC
ncbi:ragulator complex protein LAMTOR4 isoform X2 [Ahaetulla prasina]|uniref:ragulator complex protein LAMTOR4 isoform X2 n=1 Tax=Ahaetulla prasina TaxID=499056 RepID=UPI0026485BA7|nr:ragulator complex protein LAMTOR4 isoform X2 [Ahaetulla prasina]